MDSTAIERRRGLAMTKIAAKMYYGYVICCQKKYQELECGLGVMTPGLIRGVAEITSPRRSYMTMVESWSLILMVHVERVILISGPSYSLPIVLEESL